MRIISGIYRGRQFKAKAPTGVRPTADAVKESIFNVLNNLIDFRELSVLDICAGTGALGFEALSRGAEYCNFIEKNPRTARYISNVAAEFNIPTSKYDITVQDAAKALNLLNDKYHLIFFDPPYFENLYDNVLKIISEKKIMDEEGIFVIEYDEKVKLKIPEIFSEITTKRTGSTSVAYLEYSE